MGEEVVLSLTIPSDGVQASPLSGPPGVTLGPLKIYRIPQAQKYELMLSLMEATGETRQWVPQDL